VAGTYPSKANLKYKRHSPQTDRHGWSISFKSFYKLKKHFSQTDRHGWNLSFKDPCKIPKMYLAQTDRQTWLEPILQRPI
jgi:hypothetical protein